MVDTDTRREAQRATLRKQRRQLGPPERMTAARDVRHALEQVPEFMVDDRIAGYWATGGELPLNLVMASLPGRDQQFYLPVIAENRQMRFAPWHTGEAITPNRYGIPEPLEQERAIPPPLLDVVLVPLVGFDRAGHRLGVGGGYYDASFAFLRAEKRPATPLLIGIGYAFQECEHIHACSWDVPLDYIATDRELIDCTESKAA